MPCLTWVAFWFHFDRLHHGACCPVGWFASGVGCGVVVFSNDLTAVGCFALLSVLSEFLHVEIGNFTFSQLKKSYLGVFLNHSLQCSGTDFLVNMNCNKN